MSSKSSNQKHSEKKSKVVESKSTKPSQKAGSTEQPAKETKQSKSKKTTEAVATPAPVVEQKTKETKKSKKSTEAVTTPAPVVEQKGSSKKSKKATETTAPVVEESKKSRNTKAKAEAKQVEVEVENADNASNDDEKEVSGLRYFKLVYKGNTSGRYSGRKPKQAANKAYSSVIKKEGLQNGGGKIQFSIKECTRGSKQKRYTYDASRVKLDTPVEVNIVGADGKEKNITYNYNNVLQKAKQIIEQDE